VFVAVMYAAIAGLGARFSDQILPTGDPFTYTVGFFKLLDVAKTHYWDALIGAFRTNWYWAMNLPIVVLAPVLAKDPFSLSVVNFIAWGVATASVFRLARCLGYGLGVSIIASLILWVFPVNFGFLDYTSIPVVSLDAMFLGLLTTAAAHLMLFAIDPFSRRNAVLAGLATGLAVWGRGNSVAIVGMAAFLPALIAFRKLWKVRDPSAWGNAAFVLGLPALTTAIYFAVQGEHIANYYSNHLQFVQRHTWTLQDALPYLKNVPGFFFWRVEDSVATIALTWAFHAAVALTPLFVAWKADTSAHVAALKTVAATGVFIYYVTYVANLVLFTDPLMNVRNALLIWAPMRIGIAACAIAVLGTLVSRGTIRIRDRIAVPALVLMIAYGVALTRAQTPAPSERVPSPAQMEAFVRTIDALNDGDFLSILWYRNYSGPMLRYFRLKNDLPDLRIYAGSYFDRVWEPHTYTDEKRLMVRAELRDHFTEAGLIIIPEYVDYYTDTFPYSLYRFADEIERYLNSADSPRFVVRALIDDGDDQNLMVLQRAVDAAGRGEPLKLPYGPSAKPHDEYGPAVLRF
jgi:hypothetical protein